MDFKQYVSDTINGLLGRSYQPQINYDPGEIMYLSQVNQKRKEGGLGALSADYYMNTYLPSSMRPNGLLGVDLGKGAQSAQEATFVNQNPFMYSAVWNGGKPMDALTAQQELYLNDLYSRRQ